LSGGFSEASPTTPRARPDLMSLGDGSPPMEDTLKAAALPLPCWQACVSGSAR